MVARSKSALVVFSAEGTNDIMGAALPIAALALVSASSMPQVATARIADRSRVIRARGERRDYNNLAIEGGAYRGRLRNPGDDAEQSDIDANERRVLRRPSSNGDQKNHAQEEARELWDEERRNRRLRGSSSPEGGERENTGNTGDAPSQEYETPERFNRRLSSQLTGCCYTYQSYSAANMCSLYNRDCESGETPSHDSGDESCEQEGLSFIGISFSVNTAYGNPYSYQLCDQFPMENIIDRDYNYVMSMDEDGWLVGGGYKSFDYSGKMPYIDSSHTELLRIGSLDTDKG